MQRFVGKKAPTAPAPTLGDGVKMLEARGDTLEQRISKLDKELFEYKKQLKTAKGSAAANIKQRALNVLKRKKMLEKQRDSTAQQAFNLDQTAFTIETMKTTKQTVSAMKEGAKAMKQEFKTLNLDEIEDVQDDLADLMMDADEINDVMSRAWGVPDDVYDEDLDAELAGLDEEQFEAEEESETLPDYLKAAPDMPAVPTSKVQARAEPMTKNNLTEAL
jgi:charged multivesicular body protein 5